MANRNRNTPRGRAEATGSPLTATLRASLVTLDKRTVTHAAAFHALDLIDQAVGDVTATSCVLDEILAKMSDNDDNKVGAIDTVFRHLQTDLETLQRVNAEARDSIRKGGAA
jgi:hypothetical protein